MAASFVSSAVKFGRLANVPGLGDYCHPKGRLSYQPGVLLDWGQRGSLDIVP